MQHLVTINNFKKTRNRMKKLCALLHIKFFSQQDDMIKIVNFDEGVWFYGRFSEAMSYSRFALLSQKSQFTNRKFFHCLASPGLLSEASMNKEKHSLQKFAALQSGGATQRNSSLPQTWLDTKGANFENDIASINLGVILLEKECCTHQYTHSLTNLI